MTQEQWEIIAWVAGLQIPLIIGQFIIVWRTYQINKEVRNCGACPLGSLLSSTKRKICMTNYFVRRKYTTTETRNQRCKS